MADYLPYAGKHSIQEALIAIHFAQAAAPAVIERAFSAIQAEFKDDFPRSKVIHRMEMSVPISDQPADPQPTRGPEQVVGGFEFSKMRADGKPARVLRMLHDVLSVNYLEYDSWEDMAPRAKKILRLTLSELDLLKVPIVAFSLRYIDRFTFDGDPSDARADLLFRRGSKYIAGQCFDSGAIWHCNIGWFDKVEGEARILNQLNISSALVENVPAARIDHNQIYQLRPIVQTIETLFGETSQGQKGISPGLERMHETNKLILCDILLSEMAERIGVAA